MVGSIKIEQQLKKGSIISQSPNSNSNYRQILNMQRSRKRIPISIDFEGKFSHIDNYKSQIATTGICDTLIESLSPDLRLDLRWMVELDDNYRENSQFNADMLIGHTNILVGPPLSGKMGLVYWKHKSLLNVSEVVIDCSFHSTPQNFISELVEQVAAVLEKHSDKSIIKSTKFKSKDANIKDTQQLTKRIVIENAINLSALNDYIRSQPLIKFLFIARNAQVLVQIKKQTVLYNFFEWIKTDIKNQIGLVLITRNLCFVDRLEKRVKSRMNAKIVPVFGVRNGGVIKLAIVKRFQLALSNLRAEQEKEKKVIRKLIDAFEKSTAIEKFLKDEIEQSCKSITFFLQAFKLIFAIKMNDEKLSKILYSKDSREFEMEVKTRYEKAKQHLRPYSQQQMLIFQQMSIPEFIIMAIIRKMLIDAQPKISFKEIKKQIISFKKNQYSKSGNSFELSDNLFERSLRGLHKLKVIEMYNRYDIENADIISNMSPDSIKEAIEGRSDLPEYLKSLLN